MAGAESVSIKLKLNLLNHYFNLISRVCFMEFKISLIMVSSKKTT